MCGFFVQAIAKAISKKKDYDSRACASSNDLEISIQTPYHYKITISRQALLACSSVVFIPELCFGYVSESAIMKTVTLKAY